MEAQSCLKVSLAALSLLSAATWLPRMCSCLRTFLLVSLPSAAASLPKCLFVFSNFIVVFLVISESRLSRSGAGDDDVAATGGGMPRRRAQEEDQLREEVRLVAALDHALAPAPIIITGESVPQGHGCAVFQAEEEEEEEEGEEALRVDYQVEEDGDDVGLTPEVGGLRREGEEQREEEEDDVEERGVPPAGELNRRVEDFIARFNMERQLEARMLVCCC